MSLVVVIIIYAIYAPNILLPVPTTDRAPAIITASEARYAPSDAWVGSLKWMKENTPEPFGSPDAYYELHQLPPSGESYQYPDTAYGVLSWWDYGYWITRIAHRIPVANPSQDPNAITRVAKFFTATEEDSADEAIQGLDVSYVVIDHETALGKFYAIVRWSGRPESEYFDNYVEKQGDGTYSEGTLLTPAYYQTMAVRLYTFEGKSVTPENTTVITYQIITDDKGNPHKEIIGRQEFNSYEEAETFISGQESGNYRIVGSSPFKSPVPLEAVESYRLVHSSEKTVSFSASDVYPWVKIFESTK